MTDVYREIQDPATAPERLAEIVATHPELAPWVLQHPNCYDALREWIAAYATPPAGPATGAGDVFSTTASSDPFARAVEPALSSHPATPFGPAPGTQPTRPRGPFFRRRGILIGGSIGIAAIMLVGIGGAWWAISGLTRGASSPEGAVARLLSGVENVDPVTVATSLAPSEFGGVVEPLQRLASAVPGEDGGADMAQLLADVRASAELSSTAMAYETEQLADGVVRVSWTDGEMRLSGDERELARSLTALYEPLLRAQQAAIYGYSDAEIDEAIDAMVDGWSSNVDLDQSWDARDAADWYGAGPISLVAVDEGNGWYISPLLSFYDLQWRQSEEQGYVDSRDLGDAIIEAEVFETPEVAAEELTAALESGRIERVAATLPLAERRVLSLYGDVFNLEYVVNEYSPSIETADFSAATNGDRARLSIEELLVDFTEWSNGYELHDRYDISEVCAEWSDEYLDSSYSSWWDEYTYWTDQRTGSACLDDPAWTDRLGAGDVDLIAVREGGGWLVSPIATIADAASIAVDSFIPYYESGALDELFR